MDRTTLRHTFRGALAGVLIFGAVALVQAIRSGTPVLSVAQPIAVIGLIGLTVGGLAGPLIGRALGRRRR